MNTLVFPRKVNQWLWTLAVSVLILFVSSASLRAGDTTADRVLGQVDFVFRAANFVDAKGVIRAESVAIDRTVNPNRVYVADTENSRVLAWADAAAFSNGDPADLAIGQADFISSRCNHGVFNNPNADSLCLPRGVAVDGFGNVYVADFANHRVLEYDSPFSTDTTADLVFGQGGSFTTNVRNNGGVSADSLHRPNGVAVDGWGNLYVVDRSNHRVLEYDSPLSTNTTADLVFGQPNFISNLVNNGGVSADSLDTPDDVAVDGFGNLYVADRRNHRVLEYDSPLSTDTTADRVFGQGGIMTTGICNKFGVSAGSLCFPRGVAVDGSDNLYVASLLSRVLEYDSPVTMDTTADRVIGQPDFISSGRNRGDTNNPTADSLCEPRGMAVDGWDNLYVADLCNSRVLEYDSPLTTDTTADRVLGQVDFVFRAANLADGKGVNEPASVAIDRSVNPNRIYVADTQNSRVLSWADATALSSGDPADLVIGQPDFFSSNCNNGDTSSPTADSLCEPLSVAVDSFGNLYVADLRNHRVLEYDSPFSTDTIADRVFGQGGSFTTRTQNKGGRSADTLDRPRGVAVDGWGNLYVADRSNHRVLEYDSPLTTDTTADLVFGQGGSFTSALCNNSLPPFDLPNADSLCQPRGVAVDGSGNLYVADAINHRVLEYDSPLTTDTTADLVFGQGGSFTTATRNKGGISADSLNLPQGVAVDGSGNLYVMDGDNSRVLEYDSPLTTDTTADLVFGQGGSFASGSCNNATGTGSNSVVTADDLCLGETGRGAGGVAVDGWDNLYVADLRNNRILEYDTPLANAPPDANDDPAETLVNVSVDVQVLNNDTDLDGDSLSVVSTSNGPSNGLATIIGNIISYSPDTDFDGFDPFDYTISDSNGGFDTATVTVEVISAAEGVQNLINEIIALGLPGSVTKSLAAPLGNVADLLNDANPNNDVAACGKLGAFVNKVNAREGNTLTSQEAALLRGLAEDIKTSIGC